MGATPRDWAVASWRGRDRDRRTHQPEAVRAFDRLRRTDSLRVAVVTAAGERFFSAGWDLMAAAAGGEGIEAELALAADLIVAEEHAEFGLPETGIGMIADSGGVLRLPKRLPRSIATEPLLTGRRMGAQEAARWGLVNEVTGGPGTAVEAAISLGGRVAEGAPLAIAAVKEVLRETENLDVPSGYGRLRSGDLRHYGAMLASQDAREGPRAFAEKRPPRWQGR